MTRIICMALLFIGTIPTTEFLWKSDGKYEGKTPSLGFVIPKSKKTQDLTCILIAHEM